MLLLDTNVVSELRKLRSGKADKRVAAWADSVDASELYLSVIVLQEIEIGVLLVERRDPAQGKRLRAWFDDRLLPAFSGRVLPVTEAVARASAKLHVPDPRPIRRPDRSDGRRASHAGRDAQRGRLCTDRRHRHRPVAIPRGQMNDRRSIHTSV